ncbi:MAG TPA: hypothetical protein VIU41_06605 [Geobacteraceae bacterium]
MHFGNAARQRLKRLFQEGFSVMDIAEPLASFDAERPAGEVSAFMAAHDYDLAGVRRHGLVSGYVRRTELAGGCCGDHLHPFGPDDLVAETDPLQKVVESLAINNQCFVTVLDRVGAIVTLSDLEKPPMRMFLFGMITIQEMIMTRAINEHYGDGSWRQLVSEGRLAKAVELHRERQRRNQDVDLLDCLQFSDKSQILLKNPDFIRQLGEIGLTSRKAALQAAKELEALRNNLAHTQEIIPEGWQRIAIFATRLEYLLERL